MFPLSIQAEDAEELAAGQRLGRLSTRNSTAQSSRPPATSSAASSTAGTARQSAASMSGRHIAPPKLSPDDGWAAELDNNDSWDSIDQKTAAGVLCSFDFAMAVASSQVLITLERVGWNMSFMET